MVSEVKFNVLFFELVISMQTPDEFRDEPGISREQRILLGVLFLAAIVISYFFSDDYKNVSPLVGVGIFLFCIALALGVIYFAITTADIKIRVEGDQVVLERGWLNGSRSDLFFCDDCPTPEVKTYRDSDDFKCYKATFYTPDGEAIVLLDTTDEEKAYSVCRNLARSMGK